MKYYFYCKNIHTDMPPKTTLDCSYSYTIWKPSPFRIVPSGIRLLPFGIWWLMHYLRIFKNRDYSLFIVYHKKTLVHRSAIFPRYFRFPFMTKDDLQIGDTWTNPAYRNQGIASFAVQQILRSETYINRRFWYIVEENNLPSISVVKKYGFKRVYEGFRKKRFGLLLFGFFEPESRTSI